MIYQLLRKPLKKNLLNFLWGQGYDLQATSYTGKSSSLTRQLLLDSKADILLDVGANEGQFAQEVLLYEKKIPIISYEPISFARDKLLKNAQKFSNWKVGPKVAVTNVNGQSEIFISQNVVSSSLKQADQMVLDADSTVQYVGKESVELRTLDSLIHEISEKKERIFLKLDVQGSEKDVLEGAREVLKNVVALQIEMSVVTLYKEEMLLNEWLPYMKQLGFKLYAFSNGFRDPKTKELLQCDGFFIKI